MTGSFGDNMFGINLQKPAGEVKDPAQKSPLSSKPSSQQPLKLDFGLTVQEARKISENVASVTCEGGSEGAAG